MRTSSLRHAVCFLLLLVVFPSVASAQRARLDVKVFARIPERPGLPEGIATGPDGTVYVGTNPGGNAPGAQNGVASKIYAFRPDGTLLRDYEIRGQDVTRAALPAYGLQQLAFDGDGMLYALDKAPARVLRIDPASGKQTTYATFADVPTCTATGGAQPCSQTVEDVPPFPNYPAFAPDGSIIVSDFQQGLLWRVPRGGGAAQVLLTDSRLDNPLGGPNGLQFRADGRTLVVTQSIDLPLGGSSEVGNTRLFETTIDASGATPLREFYASPPGDAGDGLALGRSGDTYLQSFVSNQIIRVAPDGREVERIRTQPDDELQFDSPASSVFVDDRLLVTNQSVNVRNAANFAVLDVLVGEPGLPLFRPKLNTGDPADTGTTAGTAATCKSRRVLRYTLPRGASRATVSEAGKTVRSTRRGRVLRVDLRGRSRASVRLVIRARVADRRYRRVSVVHPCRGRSR